MGEWFHASNSKTEVRSSKILIAQTLQLIKDVFPRTDTNGEEVGQGWSIPKFHGATKFTDYIMLFGSAINFFGGVGECNHKTFVKATGHNTQKRSGSFTSQVATRYYEAMTIGIAKDSLEERRNGENEYIGGRKSLAKYILTIEGLVENGIFDQYDATQKKSNISLHINLVRGIAIYASCELNCRGTVTTSGFTLCKLNIEEREEIFRCTSKFAQDGEWYDWCLI